MALGLRSRLRLNDYPTAATDPYWNVSSSIRVALLIEPGNNGAQADGSTVFTDISPTPKTVTTNGNAQVDTGVLINGFATLLMDGTGDFLSLASHADFGFGTGDFTMECWLRRTSTPASDQQVIDLRPSGSTNGMMYINSVGKLEYYNGSPSGGGGALSVTVNTAFHMALSRNSGTLKGFQGGSQQFSVAMAGDFTSARACRVFANFAGTAGFVGNANMIRLTKGAGRYTANFTPPTSYPHS